MPLEYPDLAHHYRNSETTEAEQREHFAIFADILETFARAAWDHGGRTTSLGISLKFDPLRLSDQLESLDALRFLFNQLAQADAAESERP